MDVARVPEQTATVAVPDLPAGESGRGGDGQILQLQRLAGNQAVATLVRPRARPEMTRRAIAMRTSVQRQDPSEPPKEPSPDGSEAPLIQWPSDDARSERNEPCFGPDGQQQIAAGVGHADAAASNLFGMPPDLEKAALDLTAARDLWEGASGAEPGNAELASAAALVGGAAERVSIYVAETKDVLEVAAEATRAAATEARTASTAIEETPAGGPAQPPQAPEPCFDDNQVGLINAAAAVAEEAAELIDARPPNFRKVVNTLHRAANGLAAIGGSQPGQKQLEGAIATIDRVAGVMEAYITPVEQVVREAARDARTASAQASEAATMSIRGPYAPEPLYP